MQASIFKFAVVFIFSSLFITSCADDNFFSIPPPDLSTVPEAYDFSSLEAVEIEEGIVAYIHEEGEDFPTVTKLDNVSLYLTLRNLDGDIIYSTFANGNTDPISAQMPNIRAGNAFSFTMQVAFTEGMRNGLVGMKEGERRTILVSPERGFVGVDPSSINGPYVDDTLQYDVIVSRISN